MENTGIFDGPSDAASIRAMVSWHINGVRVPLNEHCWLGIKSLGGKTEYVDVAYRQANVRYVGLLNRYGRAVLLNVHESKSKRAPAIVT